MKRVLFLVTSADEIGPNKRKTGSYLPEIAHPWHELTTRGIAIDFASPAGGTPPEYGYDPKDAPSETFRNSGDYARLQTSRALRDVDPGAYDAIFVPGGLGPMVDLADDPLVKRTVATFYETGRVVAAVCHGVVALLNATLADGSYLVAGKKLAAFSDEEEKGYAHAEVPFLLSSTLEKHGATLTPAPPWQPLTVVDGRIVTGQNPASASEVGRAIARLLEQA